MLKRILAVLLCVVMLASVLPLSASADTQTSNEAEAERIKWEISRTYYRVLYATGRSSLHGFCGLMASYQLWLLGVNSYPIVYNGNDQFDGYKNLEETDKGYKIKAYSSWNYTLEEALNAASNNGTRNVYNILVGFQWTNTSAGRYYGHALVINAIIDGMVYFSEGFSTEFNVNPGMPCVATIEEFARSYNSWTSFEGIIVFGRNYADYCQEYPANLFISVTEPSQTRTDPSSTQGEVVRQVRAGERLKITAIYRNPDKELFYRVEDCGGVSYISGENTEPFQFNYEDITYTGGSSPEVLASGEDFDLTGTIRSDRNVIDKVRVHVTSASSYEGLAWELAAGKRKMELGSQEVNDTVSFAELPQGQYTYAVYADVTNHFIRDNKLVDNKASICVARIQFAVDTQLPSFGGRAILSAARHTNDGWQYSDGIWRYYDMGQMRTGWFTSDGIDYYLMEDGAAATGWQTINGKDRYFTSTGALWTGWLETENGTMYMLPNGVAAVGQRTIDDQSYCFNEAGLLVTEE